MPHDLGGAWKLTCKSCIPKIAIDIAKAKEEKEKLAITAGLEIVPKLKKGTRIECRYAGDKEWFPGEISAVHSDTKKFDIAYDDGDAEQNVAPHFIRLAL